MGGDEAENHGKSAAHDDSALWRIIKSSRQHELT